MLSKILLGVGIFATVFAVLIFSGKIPGFSNSQDGPQGDVVVWGTFSESRVNSIIQSVNPQMKTVRVSYVEVDENDFNSKLLEALASGKGPDLILAPYQNILAQSSRIYNHPVTSVNEQTFKGVFLEGTSDVFWTPSGAIALPIAIDPMVLFFNRTMFSKHGIVSPPLLWDDLESDVLKITTLDNRGRFIETGVALGSPSTPYIKDIIMTIIEQLNQVPVVRQFDSEGKVAMSVIANTPTTSNDDVYPLSTVLTFITKFADPNQKTYSWNQYMGDARDQFVAEKLAMYIGYSSEYSDLKSRNPRARFEMTGLPQVNGMNTKTTGMRLYGIAALKSSKNLSSALYVQKLFATDDMLNALAPITGGLPPTQAYVKANQSSNPVLTNSMLIAHGWLDIFEEQSSTYVSAMLADVINNRTTITDAANTFVSRMQDLYNPIK